MCAWFLNQVQLFWGNFKQNSLKLMIEAILVADDFFCGHNEFHRCNHKCRKCAPQLRCRASTRWDEYEWSPWIFCFTLETSNTIACSPGVTSLGPWGHVLFWHKISGAQVGWKRSAARQLGRIFFVMPG